MALHMGLNGASPDIDSSLSRKSIRKDVSMKNAANGTKPLSQIVPTRASHQRACKVKPINSNPQTRKNRVTATNAPRRSARIAATHQRSLSSKPHEPVPYQNPPSPPVLKSRKPGRAQQSKVNTRSRARGRAKLKKTPSNSSSPKFTNGDQNHHHNTTKDFHFSHEKRIASDGQKENVERISSWIDSLEATEPPCEPETAPGEVDSMSSNRAQSSKQEKTTSLTTLPTRSENPGSTQKPKDRSISDTDLAQKLENRLAEVELETKGDAVAEELMKKADVIPGIFLSRAQLEDAILSAQTFLAQCQEAASNDNLYRIFESYRHEMNQSLPQYRLSTLTNEDFSKDLSLCRRKGSNEAIFQRTVLTSSIDRWRLSDTFDFTCETSWRLDQSHLVPSIQGPLDKTTSPTPDLNISFQTMAIRKGIFRFLPVRPELDQYVYPDRNRNRCFPFFFMEAKKVDGSLRRAQLNNINSAIQALYNIHECMRQVGRTREFFSKVRVFSISLNAENLEARIHWAVHRKLVNRLEFQFQVLKTIPNYTRDGVNILVQTILKDCAEAQLLPLLQETYKEILDWSKLDHLRGVANSGDNERGQKRTNHENSLADLEEQSEEDHSNDDEGSTTNSSDQNDTQNPSASQGNSRKKAKQSKNTRRTKKTTRAMATPGQSFGGSGPLRSVNLNG